MTNRLILASAGAGKSTLISKSAFEKTEDGKKVLLLTYTENNQKELNKKFVELYSLKPENVVIKGWFSFLLSDLIRPYQNCLPGNFDTRITNVNFNQSNPHRKGKITIPGRKEQLPNKYYNPMHFLTSNQDRVHTSFISKMAVKIDKSSKGCSLARLSEIYDCIYIDEVQDLVGWDYEVLKLMIHKNNQIPIFCVGDFRQKVYTTHHGTKKPITKSEKIGWFKNNKIEPEPLNISWRCVDKICEFADTIHSNEKFYQPTISKLPEGDLNHVPHIGLFRVTRENAEGYIKKYRPTILKHDKNTELEMCKLTESVNFGASKGMGFKRVLIIATERHVNFLNGDRVAFEYDAKGEKLKSDKVKNLFYVAVTRASYSVAFLCDTELDNDKVMVWKP